MDDARITIIDTHFFAKLTAKMPHLQGVLCLDLEDDFWQSDSDSHPNDFNAIILSVIHHIHQANSVANALPQFRRSAYRPWQWIACIWKKRFDPRKTTPQQREEWREMLADNGISVYELDYANPRKPAARHETIRYHIGQVLGSPYTPPPEAVTRPKLPAKLLADWAAGRAHLTPAEPDAERAAQIAAYIQPDYRMSAEDFQSHIGQAIGMNPRRKRTPGQEKPRAAVLSHRVPRQPSPKLDLERDSFATVQQDLPGVSKREAIAQVLQLLLLPKENPASIRTEFDALSHQMEQMVKQI